MPPEGVVPVVTGRQAHMVEHQHAVNLLWGLLVLHSDGIATRWRLQDYAGLATRHPSVIAGVLYRDFHRERDDATALVVSNGWNGDRPHGSDSVALTSGTSRTSCWPGSGPARWPRCSDSISRSRRDEVAIPLEHEPRVPDPLNSMLALTQLLCDRE
jgi:hypothetical protein